ncbi:MAG: endolytic transglycosylase MltG [Piscirickettsiaceae bacterium]|nr:endolytic transglycosylase MltG [Piscirickettsiaceae bacterium]
MISIAISLWMKYQLLIITPLNIDKDGYNYSVNAGTNLGRVNKDFFLLSLIKYPTIYIDIYGCIEKRRYSIKMGNYHIKYGETFPQLLDQIISGGVIQYAITFIEGMTIQKIIEVIADHPHITHTLINMNVLMTMTNLGEHKLNSEGWFYPETYYFSRGTTDLNILRRSHQRMVSILNALWDEKAEDLPYKDSYEALIMSSIIEKETGIPEERSQIAGVFVRRLKKGMLLQTDPTVIYGLGNKFDGDLRREDLELDTLYNTYMRPGLPPTPISSASIESLEAALHPANSKNLYFVATGQDGRHIFSSSLKDHNNAVRRYQKNYQ